MKFSTGCPITPIFRNLRVTSLKILRVPVTSGLSAPNHIRESWHHHQLRADSMHCESYVSKAYVTVLQTIYRSVIIAKLICESSAWWDITNASDGHRSMVSCIVSFWCSYCALNLPPFKEQCTTADRKLFD